MKEGRKEGSVADFAVIVLVVIRVVVVVAVFFFFFFLWVFGALQESVHMTLVLTSSCSSPTFTG